ncbi:hypothetical protein ACGH6Q_00475 [Gilliamella sp. BG2]|uniref:T6SS immunity protein Tli3 family protein n=2 Tax=unclassified Gilliamella TaxID=2685620 RepID=UPI0039887271
MMMLAILSTLIGGALFIIMLIKQYRERWQMVSYLFFILGILALSPVNNIRKPTIVPPSQIVYRFDENRYILLTGYRCEGQAYFIDDKEQVYYLLDAHSWDLYTEPYRHPAKNYLSIPLSDVSAIYTSIDGGRSFRSIRLGVGHYLGNHDSPQYDVVNDQAFILGKDGQLYASEAPFGTKGWYMLSKKEQLEQEAILGRSQIIPESIPPIPSDYTGWDKMRCDYNAKGTQLPDNHTVLEVYQHLLGTAK